MKVILVLIATILLTGCADTVTFEQAAITEKVGFWFGLWHGFIFPVAWLLSLFMDEVAVYAIYNNGGWYDSGYFLGLGGLSGVGFLHKDGD